MACFYQLAFNASEFVAKLRANNRFLLAFQIALAACDVTYAGTDGQIFACKEMEEDGGENALGGRMSLRERDFLGADGPSRTPSRRVSATEFAARAKEARGGGAAVSRRNSRTETRDERAHDEKAPDEDFGGRRQRRRGGERRRKHAAPQTPAEDPRARQALLGDARAHARRHRVRRVTRRRARVQRERARLPYTPGAKRCLERNGYSETCFFLKAESLGRVFATGREKGRRQGWSVLIREFRRGEGVFISGYNQAGVR